MTAETESWTLATIPGDDREVRSGLLCPDCFRFTLTRRWFGLATVVGVGVRSVLIDSCPCDARGDALL